MLLKDDFVDLKPLFLIAYSLLFIKTRFKYECAISNEYFLLSTKICLNATLKEKKKVFMSRVTQKKIK